MSTKSISFLEQLNKSGFNKEGSIVTTNNGEVSVQLNDEVVITARDYDFGKKTGHVYYNRCIKMIKYNKEFVFGINVNSKSGLSHLTIRLYKIDSTKEYNNCDFEIVQNAWGMHVRSIKLVDDYDASWCDVESYEDLIRDHLNRFDCCEDINVREGIDLLISTLIPIIQEIIEVWASHIDQYIEYLSNIVETIEDEDKRYDYAVAIIELSEFKAANTSK